jgi:asparagine synthase (glutamine-hydrolysing)
MKMICFKQPKGNILGERLSIIDLSFGKQPIQGTDEAWMVHNGDL